jgi:hypothetical protein
MRPTLILSQLLGSDAITPQAITKGGPPMFRMRLRKRIVGVRDADGQFALIGIKGNELNLKLSARDIRSIRQALKSFPILSLQERFKQQLNYLPSRRARDKLARIYRSAHEMSIDAAREAMDHAFQISVEEAAARAAGTVREFLDGLLV